MKILFSALFSGGDPFHMFDRTVTVDEPSDLKPGGFLLLHGGADISPSIYKQQPNKYCHAGQIPSYRDAQEIRLVEQALRMQIPIIGICRGAQLLCAMDGGTLVQHIDNHVGGHHLITDVRSGDKIKANSCHHQMLKLNKKSNNTILALCEEPVYGFEEDNIRRTYDHVPEVVHFPQMNAIGVQGHPEWMPNSHFTNYCASLIKEFLFKE
jgi:gamma-glutamyl-gamma-aminobutyrate hydrolase PuuD